MEVIKRNINVLAGLYARKKCAPVLGEISEAGLGAMVSKALEANEGVNFTVETQSHEEHTLLYGLRPELQKVITDVTEATQSPWQIAFGFMLGAASIALGYKISSRWKTYTNHPNINIVVVADSGDGKSGPLDLLFAPIRQAQYEALREYKHELAEWKKNDKQGDKPHRRKYLTDDATIEAIKRDEIFNPNGLGVIKDEGVLDFLGAYKEKGTQARDDNEFIKMSNCAPIESSRKSDDEDTVASDHSYLCVVGGTQPVNLPAMFGDRRILSGMCARFLFVLPPQTHRNEQADDTPVDMSAWGFSISMMLGLPPKELQFSDDAKRIVLEYRREIEAKREIADPFTKTLYGKLQVHVLRLAMVLHYLGQNYQSDMINTAEVNFTVDCMKFFEKEWLKVFDLIKQGKPKVKLGFYETVKMDWEALNEHCMQQKTTPPSQAEFARLHGITPQNFSQKVMPLKI